MSLQTRDSARRFITLIDQLYTHNVRIVCSAAVEPDKLFSGVSQVPDSALQLAEQLQYEGAVARDDVATASVALSMDGTLYTGEDESFAFRRAVSRLMEMQGRDYWSQSSPRHQHARSENQCEV